MGDLQTTTILNSIKELDINTCSNQVSIILKLTLTLNKLNNLNKKLKDIIESSDTDQLEYNIHSPKIIQKYKSNIKKIDKLKAELSGLNMKKILIELNGDKLNLTEIED